MDKRIWIDAGHGGRDPGVQAGNLTEKTINLYKAVALKQLLEAQGFIVGMSRVTDVALGPDVASDLEARIKAADEFKADIFLSIHFNGGGGDTYLCVPSGGGIRHIRAI